MRKMSWVAAGLVLLTGCIFVRYHDQFYGTLSYAVIGSSQPEPLLPFCPTESRFRAEAEVGMIRFDQWGAEPYASCPAARYCETAECTETICTRLLQPITTTWHLTWWSTPYGIPPVQHAWLRLERATIPHTGHRYWLYHRYATALWDARCTVDPHQPCTGFFVDDFTISYGTIVPAMGYQCLNSWRGFLQCKPNAEPDTPCVLPYSDL